MLILSTLNFIENDIIRMTFDCRKLPLSCHHQLMLFAIFLIAFYFFHNDKFMAFITRCDANDSPAPLPWNVRDQNREIKLRLDFKVSVYIYFTNDNWQF